MKRQIFPFSAIVGQGPMKTALLLNAVDPGIGGVLISGHKGTGKSTAARALAQVLPQGDIVADCPYHCPANDPAEMCDNCLRRSADEDSIPVTSRAMPMVELPLSATEDRVVGTLHVEHALKTGERRFDPGLLAMANGGILYVDEVNLLDDHLVDILLDSAASGINVVEREGVSHAHPARFMLVGTMNPEEGELRPQFLDRFGLSLSVKSIPEADLRKEIIQRRIAFDQYPVRFEEKWSKAEIVLAQQIASAQSALDRVIVPDAMIDLAVRLSAAAQTQGHRAEIVILKTARALAAILEEAEIGRKHVAEAARLALPHRMTSVAMSTPETRSQKIEEILAETMDGKDADSTAYDPPVDEEDWDDISTQVPGSWAASNNDMVFSFLEEKKKLFLTRMN